MSISRAIERAYRVSQERNYSNIYWSLDLHGTVIESTYDTFSHDWINKKIQPILAELASFPETYLILWSSLHPEEQPKMIEFFESQGISVFAFNENPMEANTKTGHFDQKFYTSIIVDDKAGFEVDEWPDVIHAVRHYREKHGFKIRENSQTI